MTALLLDPVVRPFAWDDDEDPNAPWLPKIPGPRPEQVPTPPVKIPEQPTSSAAPTCCGRPMTRDGSHYVCRKCRGWADLGAALVAVVPAAARQCSTCQGKGGKEVDTSSGGVTRKSWQTCGSCRGTGSC